MPIEFINADLEIVSDQNLEPIRLAFERYGHRFSEMHCGPISSDSYMASFEVHPDETKGDQTAEEKIHAFCDSISELQGAARDSWNRAGSRVIDLGYQSDDECRSFNDRLSVETLARMTQLGIGLALTIYPRTIRNAEQADAGNRRSAGA